MHGNVKDLKGNRYGNLTVLELTDLKLKSKRGTVWKCLCDCGNVCYKTSTTLLDPRRKTCSCGCLNKGRRKFPNKFVTKEPTNRINKARLEVIDLVLERFKDAPYIDELKAGLEDISTMFSKEDNT